MSADNEKNPRPPAGPGKIIPSGPKSAREQKFFIKLTQKGFFGVLIVLLIIIVWIFIFGIIIGRGYKPEKDIPELVKILPVEGTNKTGEENQTITLTPEQLEFNTNLQEIPQRRSNADNRAVSNQQMQNSGVNASRNIVVEENDVTAIDNNENKTEKINTNNTEERYAWVYQVAAFYDTASAERFKTKIESKGLRVTIEKTTSEKKIYYRVLVHIKGTQEKRKESVDILKNMGVEKPILRDKEKI